ncbi:MAG: type II toxin-antitoxin system VapC family toxin [Myxococcales bacterium]|nr:type II toxin-antitoxin system VapC family toxin [Myxococcales bacterium]
MIALDTNVLVRFLVEDDPAQHRRAARLIERASRGQESLLVTEIVLCELVWVLTYSYKVARSRVLDTLRALLHARQLAIPSRDAAARAIDAFAGGRGDFADYLIREQAREAGGETVATFDRALLGEEGFVEP